MSTYTLQSFNKHKFYDNNHNLYYAYTTSFNISHKMNKVINLLEIILKDYLIDFMKPIYLLGIKYEDKLDWLISSLDGRLENKRKKQINKSYDNYGIKEIDSFRNHKEVKSWLSRKSL